ncbi:MAG: hypothetical protein ACJAUQ_002002 [Maribacter sp.]|jgi:hypothetical protein
MKNISFNLIIGILAAAKVIYSFFEDIAIQRILSFEVPIWMYRLFWAVLAAGCIYVHFKNLKKETNQ